MEANVFSYFMAIGSGLTLGVAIIGIPAWWIVQKIKNKSRSHSLVSMKGAKQHAAR